MLSRGDCPKCGDALIDLFGGDGHWFSTCQDCGHEWQHWSCRFCHEQFTEQPDRYDCPECGPNERRIYK